MVMHFSVVIPTFNRVQDLKETLDSLLQCNRKPIQTIIIDQSTILGIQKLVQNPCYSPLRIVYQHVNIPSLTKARNLGISLLDSKAEFIVFLDDDVTLASDFFDQIIDFFQKNPQAKGILPNITMPKREISRTKKIGQFLLTGGRATTQMVTSWGFNAIPLRWGSEVQSVERMSGCGMVIHKRVLMEGLRFQEKFMKYCLMEDCFFSYEIHQKYPNSLFFLPQAKLIHRESPLSRIADRSKILQNIIHRYYFVNKFNKSLIAYIRTMLILCGFDLLMYQKMTILVWYYQGFLWLIENGSSIENVDFNSFIFKEEKHSD